MFDCAHPSHPRLDRSHSKVASVQSRSFIRVAQDRRRKRRWRKQNKGFLRCKCCRICVHRKRSCRHDGNPSLQLRWYGEQNRQRRLLRASNRFFAQKKSHAESTQINHPSAARSSEHRMQIFSTMLDAIEEVCLFCAMCLVRVGRGMTQIQQCNDGGLCPALTSTCGQRGPAHSTCGLVRSPSVARILNAVHYRSVLIVQAVKRVHQPVRRPIHIPTWRLHISSPIIGLGLLRGFLNKSTVRWLPLASFTHFTMVLQILHGASTSWPPPRTRTLVAPPPLVLLRHTAVSTSGDPTLSCEPRAGIHRMASFEWCRARAFVDAAFWWCIIIFTRNTVTC